MESNYYDVLNVPKDADHNQIKKAYRSLSLKYHPDRNPSEEAKKKIVEVNEAYEVLSDEKNRKEYDMKLEYGDNPFVNLQTEMPDLNNLFGMMFGNNPGMMGGPGMMFGNNPGMMGGGPNIRIFHRGGPGNIQTEIFSQVQIEPIHKKVDITLQQSYNGEPLSFQNNYYSIEDNKRVFHNEEVNINIPQGIDNNETIIIPNQGNLANNQRGELRIQINLINNTEYLRNGLDLIYNKRITLKESLCGVNFIVEHINGKKLNLNTLENPHIILPNYSKIIPQMGMKKDNQIGNLKINFEVEFPKQLSTEQIKQLNAIL
jgi:DnaJ-class molecular chaperone